MKITEVEMKRFKLFGNSRKGMTTVEIVVIVAVLIGLAFIFKSQIYSLINQIFDRLFQSAGESMIFASPIERTIPPQ
jgi:hypothetical protein